MPMALQNARQCVRSKGGGLVQRGGPLFENT